MHRHPTQQLMTVEEAESHSRLHTAGTTQRDARERPSIWAWQSVAGALEQTVSEAQIERALRATRR